MLRPVCFIFFPPHCRTHNSLFLPENMARLSETFSRAHDLMDAEKKVVLGKRSTCFLLTVCELLKKTG